MPVEVSPAIDGADNTEIINEACRKSWESSGDKTVTLTSGDFRVDGQILLNTGVKLSGAGPAVTSLRLGPDGCVVLRPADESDGSHAPSLTDLHVLQRHSNAAAPQINGGCLQIIGAKNAVIQRVSIQSTTTAVWVKDCEFLRLTDVRVVAANDPTGAELSAEMLQADVAGVKIDGLADSLIENFSADFQNLTSERVKTIGIDIEAASRVEISTANVYGATIGVRIHPNKVAATPSQQVDLCELSKVRVLKSDGPGFLINAGIRDAEGFDTVVAGLTLRDCLAQNNGVGIQIEKADQAAQLDGIDMIGCKILGNRREGILIGTSSSNRTAHSPIRNLNAINCRIADNSTGQIGEFVGLKIGDGTNYVRIAGCSIGAWASEKISHAHNIHLAPSGPEGTAHVAITDNQLSGACGRLIEDEATTSFKDIRGNLGFVTEFSGQACILNGQTAVDVYHFCSGIPRTITITPMDNLYKYDPPYITNINDATFTIVLGQAAYANKFFSFYARMYP